MTGKGPPGPPSSPVRVVSRNFLALGLGEAVGRLIAFAATVVAARHLGAAMYGVVGVATAVTLYLNRVIDGGLDLGLGVREVAADPRRIPTMAPSILTGRLIVAGALGALLILIGLTLLPQPDGATLAVMGLTLLAVGGGTRWIHLGLDRTRSVALVSTVGQTLAALLLVLLVHGPGDVTRVPLAQLAGDGVVAILLLWQLTSMGLSLGVRLDWSVIRPLLPRARSLVVSALLGLLIYNSGFIFLRVLRGAAAVGYYNAAYTLVTFFLNLGIAYNLSLLPSLTRLGESGDEQHRLYHTAMAHVFAAGFPIALGASLLAPQVMVLLYGTAFQEASLPLRILVWCIPLCLLRDVPLMALMARQREGLVLRVTAWAAGLSLTLNLALIPRYGTLGAAWASVATEAVRMFIALYYLKLEGFKPTDLRRFWRPALGGLVMTLVLVAFRPSLWAAIPVGAVYVCDAGNFPS